MNKETKTLPQAIKTVVDNYGRDVVNDIRMVNIMGDLVSLDDSIAVKNILRVVLKAGYGKKMLAISANDNYRLKVRSYSKEIADSHGYKDVIVQFVLYSIAFGIGLCPGEPKLRTLQNVIPRNNDSNYIDKGTNKNEQKISLKLLLTLIVISSIFVIWGIMYLNSSPNRKLFEESISSGNTFALKGDYVNAVENYKDAYKNYQGLNSDSYKEEALENIDALTDKLLKEGETDYVSLHQAHQTIKSEMLLDLNPTEKLRLQEKLNDIEKVIAERTENGCNTLITILSANNGKLDDNGKKLLLELLELSPDDHWLKLIKKYSYE